MMKGKIVLLALLAIPFFAQAQVAKERMKAYRAAIFTEELQLTETEAEKFWPLYYKYEEERRAIKAQFRKIRRTVDLLSDEEAKQQIEKMFELEEQELALKRKYFLSFLEVLPTRKVMRIPRAEQQFKRALLDRIQEQKKE